MEIRTIDLDIYDSQNKIYLILDSVENKIKDTLLSIAIFNLNMHHRFYLKKMEFLRELIIQSAENLPHTVSETLYVAHALNLDKYESATKLYSGGIHNVIERDNNYLNLVFRDIVFYDIFLNGSYPKAPKNKIDNEHLPSKESQINLGELYLCIQKSILKSNNTAIESYENILKEYKSNNILKIDSFNNLEDIKNDQGYFRAYGFERINNN